MNPEAPPSKRVRLHEGAEEQVAKIVVAGAGSWAQGWHLPQLERNPSAEILAIVDPSALTWSRYNPDMRRTEDLGKRYGVPVFDDIDGFLASSAAGSADGIIVSSPHDSHFYIGMKAMEAGLHVLLEKPMTASVIEARRLAEAAARAKASVMVNTSANFRAHAIKARELVHTGQVGEVEHVSCYMMREREFFEDPKNIAWVSPSGSMLGNGFAWGQLSHTLSWAFHVAGLTPKSVFCHMGRSKRSGADIFDSATIRCACGATVAVQGVAGLPGGNAVGTTTARGKLIENRIFGTEGCLMYCGDDANPDSGRLELLRNDGADQTLPGFYFENTAKEGIGPESLQAFIAACRGEPFCNASDAELGLKVVQAIDAMYRSAASGQPAVIA